MSIHVITVNTDATQQHINWTASATNRSAVHLTTWTTKTDVSERYQCNARIIRRHETHLAVVDRSGHVGVRGRWRRWRLFLLVLDVRFFVIARTAVVGRPTHVVGVRRDAVAKDAFTPGQKCTRSLTTCRNCRRVKAWVLYRCRHVFMRLSLRSCYMPSRKFHSCIFYPCNVVPLFLLPYLPARGTARRCTRAGNLWDSDCLWSLLCVCASCTARSSSLYGVSFVGIISVGV